MALLARAAAAATCAVAIVGAAVLWAQKQNVAQPKPEDDTQVIRARAGSGDADAQLRLASRYFYGRGVPQDYGEAARWYRKAAEQGSAKAEYGLGFLYREGRGVPQDNTEAARWFRKAADQGYAMAESYLGILYRNGLGVPRDDAEAIRWFLKAAPQGDDTAQAALAIMYYRGQGGPRNYAEAAHWGGLVLCKGAAHCFVKLNIVHGRWTSIVAMLLLLPAAFVSQRRWGRAPWLPLALLSAGSAAALIHEFLLTSSPFGPRERILVIAFAAAASIYGAIGTAVTIMGRRRESRPKLAQRI